MLLTELGYRAFRARSKVTLPVNFSDYGEDDVKRADFECKLKFGEQVVFHTEKKDVDLPHKGICKLTEIEVEFPDLVVAQKLRLSFALKTAGKTLCENEWNVWLYPDYRKTTYDAFTSYRDGEVAVTKDVRETLALLREGKRVCLVYRSPWTRHVADKTQANPEYAFKATWNRFKPVIWDRGTNYGGLCRSELLQKYGFPSGEFYDFDYSRITEDCDKIILDDFPCEADNLITGIDKSTRDRFDAYRDCFDLPELMYDRTMRRFSYLFGVNVGKGKLLVCGMNLTGLDESEPSAESMAHFILNYLKSEDFAPKNVLSVAELEKYLKECASAPVKERMMTQFWELDDAPVESKQYWEDSRKYLE